MRRPNALIVVILAAVLLSAGCVYYNTFFNGKKKFQLAEQQGKKTTGKRGSQRYGGGYRMYEEAIEKFSKVIDRHPNSKWVDDAYYYIGLCYFRMAQYEKSIRAYREILENHPQSKYTEEASFWIALCRIYSNDIIAGTEILRRLAHSAEKKQWRASAWYELGEIFFEDEEFDSAATAYLTVAEDYSSEEVAEDARFKAGEALTLAGQGERALEQFHLVLKENATDNLIYRTRVRMADAYFGHEQVDSGLVLLQTLANDDRYFDSLGILQLRIGGGLEQGQRFDEAMEIYNDVTETFPKTTWASEAYYRIGYINQGHFFDFAAAREFYQKAKDEFARGEYARKAMELSVTLATIEGYRAEITAAASPDTDSTQAGDTTQVADSTSAAGSQQVVDSRRAVDPSMAGDTTQFHDTLQAADTVPVSEALQDVDTIPGMDTVVARDTASAIGTIVAFDTTLFPAARPVADTLQSADTTMVVDTALVIDTTLAVDTTMSPTAEPVIDTTLLVDTTLIIDSTLAIGQAPVIEMPHILDTVLTIDTMVTIDTLMTIDTTLAADTTLAIDTVWAIDTLLAVDTTVIVDTVLVTDTQPAGFDIPVDLDTTVVVDTLMAIDSILVFDTTLVAVDTILAIDTALVRIDTALVIDTVLTVNSTPAADTMSVVDSTQTADTMLAVDTAQTANTMPVIDTVQTADTVVTIDTTVVIDTTVLVDPWPRRPVITVDTTSLVDTSLVIDSTLAADTATAGDTLEAGDSTLAADTATVGDTLEAGDSTLAAVTATAGDTLEAGDSTLVPDTPAIGDTTRAADSMMAIDTLLIFDTTLVFDTTVVPPLEPVMDTLFDSNAVLAVDTTQVFDSLLAIDTSMVYDTLLTFDTTLVFDTALVIEAERVAREKKAAAARAAAARARLATAYFRLAEAYHLILEVPDSALFYYDSLIAKFPESEFVPRAIFANGSILEDHFHDSAAAGEHYQKILEQYGRTDYAGAAIARLGLAGSSADTGYPAAEYRIAERLLFVEDRPESALVLFDNIVRDYPDSDLRPKAAYASVTVSEQLSVGEDSTLYFLFQEIVDSFPGTPYAVAAKEKMGTDVPARQRPVRTVIEAESEDEEFDKAMRDIRAEQSDTTVIRWPRAPRPKETGQFVYPESEMGQEPFKGKVVFKIWIDFTGQISEYEMIQPSNRPDIDLNATEAVQRTFFEPDSIPPESLNMWYLYEVQVTPPAEKIDEFDRQFQNP